MASNRPPTIDPAAADRWDRVAPLASPWLHDEVARRMQDRLQWIRLQPLNWTHWEPVRGGLGAQPLLARRYPQAQCFGVTAREQHRQIFDQATAKPWWQRWGRPERPTGAAPEAGVQMLWANMALHLAADPQALISRWHRALAVDGFLMFSCLGPDSLRELRALYQERGWPPPAHDFTDMHDWGDMLVQAGFAEPVMDMEHITLTWDSPRRALAELRELGANLHPARFPALRGRRWKATLEQAMAERLRGRDGRLSLTFEVVYGHAFKPPPRVKLCAHSSVSLEDMQVLLRSERRPSD